MKNLSISTKSLLRLGLLLVVIVGAVIRTDKALQLERIAYDDVVSFLVASGNMHEFYELRGNLSVDPRPVAASHWQALFKVDKAESLSSSLAGVVDGLREYDIHPPLYFMWLNVVLRASDALTPWTGWASNALFYVLNCLLLYALATRLLNDKAQALCSVVIWSFSVAAVTTSLLARHYEAMVTAVLVSALWVHYCTRLECLRSYHYVPYGLILIVGFLTNYLFIYHIAALSLCIFLHFRRQPGVVINFALTTVLAIGLALWCYPALIAQADVVSGRGGGRQDSFSFRLGNSLEELLKFCLIGTLLSIVFVVRRGFSVARLHPTLLILLVINLLAGIGCYISFLSPRHAMGPNYLAAVWPFLSMFLASILLNLFRWRLYRYGLVVLVAAPALLYLLESAKHKVLPTEITEPSLVLGDFLSKGNLGEVVLAPAPDQLTWMGTQQTLLADDRWSGWVSQAGSAVYISDDNDGSNTIEGRKAIVKRLRSTGDVQELTAPDSGYRFYMITPIADVEMP